MEEETQVNKGAIQAAAKIINDAEALVICTGAGMGVGSGLGTFRGKNAGIWPPLKRLGMDFSEMSDPSWFTKDPHLGWSFWHFRFTSYTAAEPHSGYQLLTEWATKKPLGCFSFTSNIDGHWIRCGFPEDKVIEVHGSIMYLQCSKGCQMEIWDTPKDVISQLTIDPTTDKVTSPLPQCNFCERVARPNVLMFGDWGFLDNRYDEQEANYTSWLEKLEGKKVAIVEIGAGQAVPTVRIETEKLSERFSAPIVRINPLAKDAKCPPGPHVSLCMNGEDAVREINAFISRT